MKQTGSIRDGSRVATKDEETAEDVTHISTSGPATATTEGVIQTVPAVKMRSKAEEEMFMNELVEVEIEADDDPNAPLYVHSAHNGVDQYIKRGSPQIVRRRFLYSLLAAKRKQFTCSFGKGEGGVEYNRLPGTTRPTHKLIIHRDDNPNARAWFKQVLQESNGAYT